MRREGKSLSDLSEAEKLQRDDLGYGRAEGKQGIQNGVLPFGVPVLAGPLPFAVEEIGSRRTFGRGDVVEEVAELA